MAAGIMSVVGSTGASGGGTAAGTGSGIGAGSTVASDASSGASNFGLVGGALDSLGFSPTGWIDRASARQRGADQQKNLDREFEENIRRWGLDFALREFAARAGITMQMAEQMWNAQSSRENLETSDIQQQQARMQIEEANRRKKLAKAFIKGFGRGMAGV